MILNDEEEKIIKGQVGGSWKKKQSAEETKESWQVKNWGSWVLATAKNSK